ncbi:MAG TPA: hypothetical protein VJB15_01770 [Rhodothermia bacterium]|nr:hypothetical protein [Rhodothermia bacterium]
MDRSAVPYMITGSLASSLYGEPRSTQDIDIVIDPETRSLEALLKQFPDDTHYVSKDAAFSALELRSQFNVIDLITGWKVDLIVRKDREFSRTEFGRRMREEAFGLRVYVASPEDVILVKLEWAKAAGSERQIRDVAGILRLRQEDLDFEYIESWLEKLHVQEQWRQSRELAQLD